MNSAQLHEWMKHPGSLGKDASAELDDVVQRFPFFQTAHLLYLKSLHNENSFLYNNQLKTVAAYAVNRKVLYDLITNKHEKPEVRIEKLVMGSGNPDSYREKAENEKQEEKVIQPEFPKKRFTKDPDEWESGMIRQLQLLHHWNTSPAEILAKRLKELEAEKSPTKPVENKTEIPGIIEKPKTEPEKKPTATDEINTLLYVLVEPAHPEDLPSEVTDDESGWEVKTLESESANEEKAEVPEDTVQQEIMREAITSSIELEVDDKLPTLEELTGVPSQKTEFKLPVFEERKSGMAKEHEETAFEEKKSESETTFSGWLNSLETSTEKKTEIKGANQEKLIEKFIQEEPRIQPSKTAFYNPINMARKSVQDNEEFMTETLARIYAKQGNIPKAIRVYQKLSLKYPEKTVYFAALIEELKRTPTK